MNTRDLTSETANGLAVVGAHIISRRAGGEWDIDRAPAREGKTCGDCHRELTADDPVFRMCVPVGVHGGTCYGRSGYISI